MNQIIKKQIAASIKVKRAILDDPVLLKNIAAVAARVVAAYRGGHKLLLAGNGGSAADAQHIAGEMVNRFRFDRPALPAVALSTDTSVLTAIGNDSSFDQVFARQIQALGRPGDVFIGISTSGNSPNIVKALQECKRRGIVRVGLTGQAGGAMRAGCDYCLRVPARETPRIQEAHILLAHILCGLVEEALFGKV
jgi:D-sedoheptulose 7-phosphate isomerase